MTNCIDGGRLRATSDAASLDIAERLALDEQQHDLDQEDQDCMAATAAQVRFATATATANAATASEKDASSVCATPQQVTTGRSIMTRLSTPRFF